MFIKVKRSRSYSAFDHYLGTSVEKLKQEMIKEQNNYRILRSRSEKSLNSLAFDKGQQQSKASNKVSGLKLPSVNPSQNKPSKPYLKIQPLKNMTLKLDTKKQLRQQIPHEGYAYLDLQELNDNISQSGNKLKPIIQKSGVILEEAAIRGESEFYSTQQFQRIIEICKKIKKIQFFRDLVKTKLFWLWKYYMKKMRVQNVMEVLGPKIDCIYNPKLVEIKILISQIRPKKFIAAAKLSPIPITKYREYLEEGCARALSILKENSILKIVHNTFVLLEEKLAVEEEKLTGVIKRIDDKLSLNSKIKSKKAALVLNDKRIDTKSYRLNLSFDQLITTFTIFFRKMLYFLTDSSIFLFSSIIQEIKQTLTKIYKKYREKRKIYRDYLMSLNGKQTSIVANVENNINIQLENLFETLTGKKKETKAPFETFAPENEQIEYILIPYSNQSAMPQELKYYGQQTCRIFHEYIDYIKKVVQEENLLSINETQQAQTMLLREISNRTDEYKSKNFLDELQESKKFKAWIEEFVRVEVGDVKQILQYLQPLIQEVNQFIAENEALVNNIKKYNSQPAHKNARQGDSIIRMPEFESTKNVFLAFFERKAEIIKRMDSMPSLIGLSLFCVSLAEVKNSLMSKISEIENAIKKYVPLNFDRVSVQFFSLLTEIDKKISIYNWSIEQFISSAKGQQEYEEINNSGFILVRTEMLNKLLAIIAQISDTLFKEKYVRMLEIKQEIKKITTKLQSFQLKKTQKLKDFGPSIELLKQQIWKQLSFLQGELHQKMSSELTQVSEMVTYFAAFQSKLMKIKGKIDNTIFMQNLQIDHYLLTQKTTQFTSYSKMGYDAQLLKDFLNRYVVIKAEINRIFNEELKTGQALDINQQLIEAINECKSLQQSLLPYSNLINKIKGEYSEFQLFFKMTNELTYLDRSELEQIENKKYFDFLRKKTYLISEIYEFRLHERMSQLNKIFAKKYYRKVLADLLDEFEDFIDRTKINVEIQIVKCIKYDTQKQVHSEHEITIRSTSSPASQNRLMETDGIIEDTPMEAPVAIVPAPAHKRTKRRSILEVATSEKIPAFSNLEENRTILTEFQLQMSQLIATCESLSQQSLKQQANQLFKSIMMLLQLFKQISEGQAKYIDLFKNGCMQGSPLFEDLTQQLDDTKERWGVQIIGQFCFKNISYIIKHSKELKKNIELFRRQLATINNIIQNKIENRRREYGLLFLCNNSTVFKIMQNPLNFIHQFYSSANEIYMDPDTSELIINTYYKQEIRVSMKSRKIYQVNKLRSEIATNVKKFCFLKMQEPNSLKKAQVDCLLANLAKRLTLSSQNLEESNQISEESLIGIGNIREHNNYELLQISYLKYIVDLQTNLKGRELASITNILNKEVELLSEEYGQIQANFQYFILKIDLFISACVELRQRLCKKEESWLGNCLAYSTEISESKKVIWEQRQSSFSLFKPQTDEPKKGSIIQKVELIKSEGESEIVHQSKRIRFKPSLQGSDFNDTDSITKSPSNNFAKELQNFHVKLVTMSQGIELSYDLIDPRSLNHYIGSERMLLSLFNAFRNPDAPSIATDYEIVESVAAKLFRMCKRVELALKNTKNSANLYSNFVKLSQIVVIVDSQYYSTDWPSQVCEFYEASVEKYIKQQQLLLTAEFRREKEQIIEFEQLVKSNLPNFFVLQEEKFTKMPASIKKKYQTICLEIPDISVVFELFGYSLRLKYDTKLIKILIEYFKSYHYLLEEIKKERLNVKDSKLLFLYIIEQVQSITIRQYEGSFQSSITSKKRAIEDILRLPFAALGLRIAEIEYLVAKFELILHDYIEKGIFKSLQALKKDTTVFSCQSSYSKGEAFGAKVIELRTFLGDKNFTKVSNNQKIVTLLGPAGVGKSHSLKVFMGSNKEVNYIQAYVNVNLHNQFSKLLHSKQSIEQLRNRIINRSQSDVSKYQNTQILIIYEGTEGMSPRQLASLTQRLINPELNEVRDYKVKSLLEIRDLTQLSPKAVLNLQIINFNDMQVEYDQYLKCMEQFVYVLSPNLADGLETSEVRKNKDWPINQFTIFKTIVRQTFYFIPQIYDLLINQNDARRRQQGLKFGSRRPLSLVINRRQFYCMYVNYFKAFVTKNDKKWKLLISTKLKNSLLSLRKTLAYICYWVIYYTLAEWEDRSQLFERMFELKQFLHLYYPSNREPIVTNVGPELFNELRKLYTIPSGTISDHTLENKKLLFTSEGIIFEEVNLHVLNEEVQNRAENSLSYISNIHQFLYVETPQIKQIHRIFDTILSSKSGIKGVYIMGQPCSGKSKLITNLLENYLHYLAENKEDEEALRNKKEIFKMSIKRHEAYQKRQDTQQAVRSILGNKKPTQLEASLKERKLPSGQSSLEAESPRDAVKNVCIKLSKLISQSNFSGGSGLGEINSFNEMEAKPAKIIGSHRALGLVYVDDCSMFLEDSLRGSIVHQFLKNLCEHGQFLVNEDSFTVKRFKVMYESRLPKSAPECSNLLAVLWYLYPIIMVSSTDYLASIFQALIRKTVLASHSTAQLLQRAGSDEQIGNILSIKKENSFGRNLIPLIKNLCQKHKSTLGPSIKNPLGTKKSANKMSEWETVRKPATWTYMFGFETLYKSLVEFIIIAQRNQIRKSLKQATNEEQFVKCGNLQALKPVERVNFANNWELGQYILESMTYFNLGSRVKKQHKNQLAKRKSLNSWQEFENNLFKYKDSSLFQENSFIDTLKERIGDIRTLRRPILYDELRENIYKLEYAFKTSQFIMVNRSYLLEGNNLTEMAIEVLGLKIHKIDGIVYDFQGLLSRVSKMEKNSHTCIYIPLETIYSFPHILNEVAQQISIFYKLGNLVDTSAAQPPEDPHTGNEMSIHMSSYNSDYSKNSRKNSTKYQQYIQQNQFKFTFIVEYPEELDRVALAFMENREILNYSAVVWLDPPVETSVDSFHGIMAIKKNTYEQGDNYIQSLRQKNLQDSSKLEYFTHVYPKRPPQQLDQNIRTSEKIFSHLKQELKPLLPCWAAGYIFSYEHELKFMRCFMDMYSRSQLENNNKINSIESAVSALEFLFREYDVVKTEYNQMVKAKKQLNDQINMLALEIENKRKFIAWYTESGDKSEKNELELLCVKNEERIVNLINKVENYRIAAAKAYQQISRTEVAELKYLFNSNFDAHQEIFEIVAIILGDETILNPPANFKGSNAEKETLRKCITDVNIMPKLKEQGLLQSKNEEILKKIAERINRMQEKDKEKEKSSFMKFLIQWIRFSVKYCISNNMKKTSIAKIHDETEMAKKRIEEIFQKYKIDQATSQLQILEQSLQEKQAKMQAAIMQIDKHSSKIARASQLVQKFSHFDKLCKANLQELKLYSDTIVTDSLIASIQFNLLASLPFEFRSQARMKYEKYIDKNFYSKDKGAKRREPADFIEQDLHRYNRARENQTFSVKNSPYLLTKQRERTFNIIFRSFCIRNWYSRLTTVIDPHHIFIKQLSLLTDLSYLVLGLGQLASPSINKRIEGIDIIVIKVPDSEWTMQYLRHANKDQFMLDENSYRIKWNKCELKLTSKQQVILIKDAIVGMSEMAAHSNYIVYYDFESIHEYEKVVHRVIRAIHCSEYTKNLSFLQKGEGPTQGMERWPASAKYQLIKHYLRSHRKNKEQQFYKVIEQICKDISLFGFGNSSHMSSLVLRVETLMENLCKYEELLGVINTISSFVYFEDVCHSNVGKEFGAGQGMDIRKLCRIIAAAYDIVRNKLSSGSRRFQYDPQRHEFYEHAQKLLSKQANIQESSCTRSYDQTLNPLYLRRKQAPDSPIDISVLESGIEAAYEYAKEATKNGQISTPMHEFMLKFLFNYLLLGVNDSYLFFYELELQRAYINEQRKFSPSPLDLPGEIFKAITLIKGEVDESKKKVVSFGRPRNASAEKITQISMIKSENSQESQRSKREEIGSQKKIGTPAKKSVKLIITGSKKDIQQQQPEANLSLNRKSVSITQGPEVKQPKRLNSSEIKKSVRRAPSPVAAPSRKLAEQNSSQNTALEKYFSPPLYWQYSYNKMLLNNKGSFNVSFQRTVGTIYRELKKFLAAPMDIKNKQEILGLVNKQIRSLINQQTDIGEESKLQLLRMLDRKQYYRVMLLRALKLADKYDIKEDKPKKTLFPANHAPAAQKIADNQDMQGLVARLHTFWPISETVYRRIMLTSRPEEKRDVLPNIFCSVNQKSQLDFLLAVLAKNNSEVEYKILSQPHHKSEGLFNESIKASIQVEDAPLSELQKSSESINQSGQQLKLSKQSSIVRVLQPKPTPPGAPNTPNSKPAPSGDFISRQSLVQQQGCYYHIYRPSHYKQQSVAEFQAHFNKVKFSNKRVVVVLDEQYLQYRFSSGGDKQALFSNQADCLEYVLQKKGAIVLGSNNCYYGILGCRKSAGILGPNGSYNYHRPEMVFQNNVRYCITLPQLLAFLLCRDYSRVDKLRVEKLMQLEKQKIGSEKVMGHSILSLDSHSQHETAKQSASTEQLLMNYCSLIPRLLRRNSSIDCLKAMSSFNLLTEQAASSRPVYGELSPYKYVQLCIQSLFVPGLSESESSFTNIPKIVRFLADDKLKTSAYPYINPEIGHSAWEWRCDKIIQLLAENLPLLKNLLTATEKQLNVEKRGPVSRNSNRFGGMVNKSKHSIGSRANMNRTRSRNQISTLKNLDESMAVRQGLPSEQKEDHLPAADNMLTETGYNNEADIKAPDDPQPSPPYISSIRELEMRHHYECIARICSKLSAMVKMYTREFTLNNQAAMVELFYREIDCQVPLEEVLRWLVEDLISHMQAVAIWKNKKLDGRLYSEIVFSPLSRLTLRSFIPETLKCALRPTWNISSMATPLQATLYPRFRPPLKQYQLCKMHPFYANQSVFQSLEMNHSELRAVLDNEPEKTGRTQSQKLAQEVEVIDVPIFNGNTLHAQRYLTAVQHKMQVDASTCLHILTQY